MGTWTMRTAEAVERLDLEIDGLDRDIADLNEKAARKNAGKADRERFRVCAEFKAKTREALIMARMALEAHPNIRADNES